MTPFDKNWLINQPYDYELKYYKLLAGISIIKSMILSNELHTAILAVEGELGILYNIKYNQAATEDKMKVITGIDIDNMSLSYEYPDTDNKMSMMYGVCEIAITKLENLYRIIRDIWRDLESECNITEIPDRQPINTMGYIMYIIPGAANISVYQYNEPNSFKIDWSSFKLRKVKDIKNDVSSITSFVSDVESRSDLYRFFRFDVNIKKDIPPFTECMLPLMQYSLFNKIKHGF